MKLQIKQCHICKKLGVGPNAVKLWPFEGRYYCRGCYKDPLHWDESRGNILLALQIEDANIRSAARLRDSYDGLLAPSVHPGLAHLEWEPYIRELSELAGWGLLHDDKKIFVYYFTRALWAWALKEG